MKHPHLGRAAALASLCVVAVAAFAAAPSSAATDSSGDSSANAAGTERVTEMNVVRQAEDTPPTAPWVLYTRAGTPDTAGQFVTGPDSPPLGDGSLQLQTVTSSEKVFLFNYDHVGTALSDVDDIGYSTYRQGGQAAQVASLNVEIDYNGPDVEGGFSTLVFEPVYNTDQGALVDGQWQDWTADGSGLWWSTRPINDQCAGATYTCLRTWDQIVASNPDATVLGGVGVNQGSGNAGLTDNVDAFTFDQTTYDFEPATSNTAEDCKNGGWQQFQDPSFKNQGECVSYFRSNSPKK